MRKTVKSIGSGNWIVDNLNSALEMWNGRLAEIWQLISTSPENFKGGGVWNVIVNINDGLKAVGYALLVLFFVMGVVKTCGSFAEMKKPEVAFKCFIRFVLAQAAVSWGMELMTGAFRVAQGMVTTIMDSSGLTAMSATTLPDELVSVIEDVGFFDSIPLWAVTLLGSQTVHLYAPQTTRKSTLIHRILSQKIRKCIWPRFILRLKMSTNRSKKLSCIITRILLGCQHNGNNTVRIPLGEC